MILDRLELTNFKRFRHEEIRFQDGITGILGNNGTGKSSLVQAIFFALYGVKATGISADYIVSGFAGPKDKCEVILDFRIGGDTFKIIRTFKKGKTVTHEAEFYRNKKLVAKEVSPVETEVKRTLGMGPTDFKNTIYAGQKDLLTLLENTPGKRKEWFLKALGIDYLSTESQKVLKEQIDSKAADLQRKEGELAAMAGRQSEEELVRLQASIATFHASISEHSKARDDKKALRQKLDAQAKILADKKLAYSRLVQQQQNLTKERDADLLADKRLAASLALIAEEEAEYHRIEKTAGSYAEVRSRLDNLLQQKAEHARLTGELGYIRREIADFAVRVETQKALLLALEKDGAEKEKLCITIRGCIGAGPEIADDRLQTAVNFRLQELIKRISTLAAKQEQYRSEREKLKKDQETIRTAGADGICPLCRQKLGNHFGNLDTEFSDKLAEIEKNAVADLAKQEQLENEKAAIENLVPSLETLRTIAERLKLRVGYENELAELRQKHDKKVLEQTALAGSIEKLAYNDAACKACETEAAAVLKVQARLTELGKKIGQAATMKQQRADLTAKIAERNADLAKLDLEIRTAAFDPAEAAKLEARIADTDAALRNEDVVIAGAEKDLLFTEEKIAEYKRAAQQIEVLQKQANELREEIENLKLTRSLIAEYVIYLMQVVRSRLEGEVSRIISEITGGRYEQVLLDADFNLLVRDIDNDYPVDRFSGGEQDDIAVALRIALSRYLAELHQVHESTFLIFDEIFGSQDEERRANLLTALRTQESRFPQILLISHIAEMQGEFANTLVIEAGTDNTSRVREA